MKKIIKIFVYMIGLVLAFILLIMAYYFLFVPEDTKQKYQVKNTNTETITVPLKKIYEEFEANSESAKSKYNGRRISTNGLFLESLNSNNKYYLRVTDINLGMLEPIVYCRLSSNILPSNLTKGMVLTISGEPKGISAKELDLYNCTVDAVAAKPLYLNDQTKKTAIKVDLQVLLAEFGSDSKKAIEKYNQKFLQISGKVSEKGKDIRGHIWVKIAPEQMETNNSYKLSCYLLNDTLDIKIGQNIKAYGTISTAYGNVIFFSQCDVSQ